MTCKYLFKCVSVSKNIIYKYIDMKAFDQFITKCMFTPKSRLLEKSAYLIIQILNCTQNLFDNYLTINFTISRDPSN